MCIAENCNNKPWKNGFCYKTHRKLANLDRSQLVEKEICYFGNYHTMTMNDKGIEIQICDRCQKADDELAAEIGDVGDEPDYSDIEKRYRKFMEWFGYDPRKEYDINDFKIINYDAWLHSDDPDFEDIEDN